MSRSSVESTVALGGLVGLGGVVGAGASSANDNAEQSRRTTPKPILVVVMVIEFLVGGRVAMLVAHNDVLKARLFGQDDTPSKGAGECRLTAARVEVRS